MQALTAIPNRGWKRKRTKETQSPEKTTGKLDSNTDWQTPSPVRLQRHPRPHTQKGKGRIGRRIRRAFTPLIDAKQASLLLGVPYTWLLAQARAGTIPHQRLGHYVRFNPDDLRKWLEQNRIDPGPGRNTPFVRDRAARASR